MLIAIDGIYSAGKSTLIGELVGRLQKVLDRPVAISDWNSSGLVGELIPKWKREGELGPHSLLFAEALDLAHRWESSIRPNLDSGAVIVADRYVLSGMARSVIRGVAPSLAQRAFDFVPRETLTVLVECAAELTLRRRLALGKVIGGYHSGRDYRRSESTEADFIGYQAEMRELYRSMAAARGGFLTVNTEERSPEECVDDIVSAISSEMPLHTT
ncbi:dTMP kinase [Nonomuraea purpurea]|uniref:Thymidylate kinase n=1 Tax=Nonomuraea purpurea TaxID=1849276 RepID=A0ABV8GPH8_9ACTN